MSVTASASSLLKSQAYVNGRWIGDSVDPVENPANGAIIGSVPRFGDAEAAQAVEAAQAAFRQWSRKSAKERSLTLRR
jgi:succinate-semialdehyde dehydrogenase/glutarate-semialdehyde dehydrogenase